MKPTRHTCRVSKIDPTNAELTAADRPFVIELRTDANTDPVFADHTVLVTAEARQIALGDLVEITFHDEGWEREFEGLFIGGRRIM